MKSGTLAYNTVPEQLRILITPFPNPGHKDVYILTMYGLLMSRANLVPSYKMLK